MRVAPLCSHVAGISENLQNKFLVKMVTKLSLTWNTFKHQKKGDCVHMRIVHGLFMKRTIMTFTALSALVCFVFTRALRREPKSKLDQTVWNKNTIQLTWGRDTA